MNTFNICLTSSRHREQLRRRRLLCNAVRRLMFILVTIIAYAVVAAIWNLYLSLDSERTVLMLIFGGMLFSVCGLVWLRIKEKRCHR